MVKSLSIKKNSLIVSCQALEDEPLHGSDIMAKMAIAAKQGGAAGIRANSFNDIIAIKQAVDLPLIGIIKKEYETSPIYITPTMEEVDELVKANIEIIAIDATNRIRPDGKTIQTFIEEIRQKYPNLLIMADISTFEEGIAAAKYGVDVVSTTLCGYTEETKDQKIPNFTLVKELSHELSIPVVCEGGIQCPGDLKAAFDHGAYACVVGSAITRPQVITKKFTDVLKNA